MNRQLKILINVIIGLVLGPLIILLMILLVRLVGVGWTLILISAPLTVVSLILISMYSKGYGMNLFFLAFGGRKLYVNPKESTSLTRLHLLTKSAKALIGGILGLGIGILALRV